MAPAAPTATARSAGVGVSRMSSGGDGLAVAAAMHVEKMAAARNARIGLSVVSLRRRKPATAGRFRRRALTILLRELCPAASGPLTMTRNPAYFLTRHSGSGREDVMLRHRWLIAFAAIATALVLVSVDAADARVGGGFSGGSRGSRTFSAPAPTRTAPSAAPVQRSITQPNRASPLGGATAARPGLFGGGLFGGLAAGFLGAGLFGLLFVTASLAAWAASPRSSAWSCRSRWSCSWPRWPLPGGSGATCRLRPMPAPVP